MNDAFNNAQRLYHIVPAVYRNRDTGDLDRYFRGCGLLLDQLQATLRQRLADNFPDTPLDGSLPCQDWLLPYFADLLNVRLVSPLPAGRRAEVANAVRWRQGKGTLWVIEEIAQAVSQLEAVLQEGWRRVAVTPRLGLPRIPATAYGYAADVDMEPPAMAARHPGLPAVTVDFRCPSGAVAAAPSNPAAQRSIVDGDARIWRQTSRHGTPCHPGSYEDVSRRTVDFRSPDWRKGHYHPDRLLLYTVPPAGFFHPAAPVVNWADPPDAPFLDLIEVEERDHRTIFRNRTFGTEGFMPVRVRGVIELGQAPDGVGPADFHTWRFEGLILENRLEADGGRVELEGCAAWKAEAHGIDTETPVISAKDCLFRSVQAARGLTRLEYCTVLATTLTEALQASDCIFTGLIRKDHIPPAPPASGCVRYSRIHRNQNGGGMRLNDITRRVPVFFADDFGDRGCGVLHPATPAAIRRGAEDGGEMGACHKEWLSRLPEALTDKLQDYMPVGLTAGVIPDPRLLEMPDNS
jgi:hypothetical protein